MFNPSKLWGSLQSSPLFYNIKGGAIALQFPLAGAEGLDLLTVLVVDVIPVFSSLNVAY